MGTHSWIHQEIVAAVLTTIYNHIRSNKGTCKVYPAPFAVYLFGVKDDFNYYEPDITVVCDPSRLNNKGCDGAPDFIVEVTSPGTASHDYLLKLMKLENK